MNKRVAEFWDRLNTDVAPDWDGSESTFQTVRVMNPEIVDDEVELGSLGSDLVFAQGELDLATENLNKIKSQVLDRLGKSKYGLLGGKVIATRSARAGGTPYLTLNKKG
jgi:hypothetical protein